MTNEALVEIATSLGLAFDSFDGTKIKFIKKTGGVIMVFIKDNSASSYGEEFAADYLNFSVWCAAQWATHCR